MGVPGSLQMEFGLVNDALFIVPVSSVVVQKRFNFIQLAAALARIRVSGLVPMIPLIPFCISGVIFLLSIP